MISPLKFQTRTIAAFPNRIGYLVGSIEGRVAVHHVEVRPACEHLSCFYLSFRRT